MKKVFPFIILLFLAIGIQSQNEIADSSDILVNNYPEGVYLTYESFLDKTPSNTKRVEARDLFKPKKRIRDAMIDNCYFYYRRSKKRVKDAFAISYEGSLYFHVKSMQKLMEKKDRKQKIDHKDSFVRVVDQGRYLYLEAYTRKGGGIGFGIGGGPVSVATGGGSREELRGVIYNFEEGKFDLFRDCKDFNQFLRLGHSMEEFECEKKQLPIDIVRNIIWDINRRG